MNIPEGWPTEKMIEAGKVARSRCLLDTPDVSVAGAWYYIFREMLAAAPTPPLRKDEPVAWMDVHDNWDLYKNKPSQVDVVPLYTHPDNSELRKAAEELISTFDRIKCLESRYGPCPAIEDLRAALEGK